MEPSKFEKSIEEAFNEILREDGTEDPDTQCLGDCADNSTETGDCAEKQKNCECMRIAENGSRFSLRLMEAMRSLQREDLTFRCQLEDIVGYIRRNYRDDGDLFSQVQTGLKQVCSQGFVMKLLENEYYLIGPYAKSMNLIANTETKSLSKNAQNDSRKKKSQNAPRKKRDLSTDEELETEETSGQDSTIEEMSQTESDERRESCECVASINNRTATNAFNKINDSKKEPIQWRKGSVQNNNESFSRRHALSRSVNRRLVNQNLTNPVSTRREADDFSDDTDEIYQQMNTETPPAKRSKTREKELKEWIKRCKSECEKRSTAK